MVFKTDSYNVSHFSMYPPGMTEASGYAECRANSEFENLSFFGLQYIINKRLIQQDPSKFDLDYAEARWNKHGEPFNRKGKASKAGRQALVTCERYTFSIPENQLGGRKNLLRTVYKDGELLIDEDFATIRERANKDGFDDFYGII